MTPLGADLARCWRSTIRHGIRNPDGSFYRVGQPTSNIQSQNEAVVGEFPLFGQWTDPRLEMPYTRQASLGWSHEIMPSTIMTIDFVRADGRDLNVRPRINVREVNSVDGTRRLAFLNLNPNAHRHASWHQRW